MPERIGVGVIGARADRGWAGVAHVPAIRAVPGLELAAVATSQAETARAAADAFGAPLAFGDPLELVRSPEVDLVSVVVKTPEHRNLVLAAVEAGKAVLCEWPLGRGLAESEALAEAAARKGVRTAIGLQGRFSPWIAHVRRLVAEGYVGRVTSTTLVAADDFSSGSVARANAYMLDAANGANPLTIQSAHFIDTICSVVGEIERVGASVATSLPEAVVRETGERVRPNTPDQIAVAGLLAGGAVASVHVRAGRPPVETVRWEIQGTGGFLRVTAPTAYIHWGALKVEGRRDSDDLAVLPTPADLFDPGLGLSEGPHHNVGYLYAALTRDLLRGTRTTPDFDAAVARHRTMDAIARASDAAVAVHG